MTPDPIEPTKPCRPGSHVVKDGRCIVCLRDPSKPVCPQCEDTDRVIGQPSPQYPDALVPCPTCRPNDFVPDYATRPVKRCKAHGLYIHSDGYVDTCADNEPTNTDAELDALVRDLTSRDRSFIKSTVREAIQSYADSRVAEARKAQDSYSRADEFLWFRRKLKEFMPQKIQARYKVFLDNFVEPHAAKYLEKMPEYEAALAQLALPNYKEK